MGFAPRCAGPLRAAARRRPLLLADKISHGIKHCYSNITMVKQPLNGCHIAASGIPPNGGSLTHGVGANSSAHAQRTRCAAQVFPYGLTCSVPQRVAAAREYIHVTSVNREGAAQLVRESYNTPLSCLLLSYGDFTLFQLPCTQPKHITNTQTIRKAHTAHKLILWREQP